ncbi:MAG: phospho-N-acetylmuramoyl-pentapeptide-transferase [Treponema sp.]|nr:phospho-N-acetylmuramoyl-pentapeptide-transferase [Treponema sp.]
MWKFLPKFYRFLPSDRGREFTLTAEAAKGKPTGSGFVFISMFVILCFLIVPLNLQQALILVLTWVMMLTGFLDDRSTKSWGEYLKAFLDLVVTVAAATVLALTIKGDSPAGKIYFWLPFLTNPVSVPVWLYILVGTVILWASVNTTNCTDGVDGLSSTLVLFALIMMGCIFYLVLGHSEIASYLLFPGHDLEEAKSLIIEYFPHFTDGASWAVITFGLSGILLGYLWHNAYPSKVLMGDAGSRALGFFIGVCVMLSGNPFLILATSTMIFIDGGLGLVKVALKRFFHINIFTNVRFPLHDHVKKNHGWSPAQVLIKFLTLQLLISIALLGIFLKIR